MEINPIKIVKKIISFLTITTIVLLIGTIIFVLFAHIELIFKILYLIFAVAIILFIVISVKRLYKKFERQSHDLSLIHDISRSLNLTVDHEVLYRINLYSIIEKLNFNSGIIIGFDKTGEDLIVMYSVGLLEKFEKKLNDIIFPIEKEHNIIADSISRNEILLCKHKDKNPYKINVGRLFGFKNYTVIPLNNINKCVGALILNTFNDYLYVDKYKHILITVSNYIAASLSNTILYDKIKAKLDENRRLNILSQKFNSVLDLDKLMKLTIEASVELIGGERGNIFIYDEKLDKLVMKASASHIPHNPNLKFSPGEGIVGKVYMSDEAYMVNDTTNDENFQSRPDSPRRIKALLDVPIRSDNKVIGVINIDNKRGGFSESDKELLQTLSSHIGIAIENARLHQELRLYSKDLQELVTEKTVKLNEAKKELEEQNKLLAQRNRIIENDLMMARTIQRQILPKNSPVLDKLEIAYKYVPMDKIGGDFYDFFPLASGKGIGFFICDVSGHGSPAAFITAMIKIACNSLPDSIFLKPDIFMSTVNERIMGYTSSNFITAFYSYFDLTEGEIRYSCAGHNRPIIYKHKTGDILDLYAKGRVLGFMDDAEFESKIIPLQKGDRVFFYTDGLSESMNDEDALYSEKRIKTILKKTANFRVSKAVELIYVDMLNWVKDPKRIVDDVAMVMFDYKP